MRELAVHLIGDRALLQHHHDLTRLLRHRRDVQIDDAFTRHARRREINLVLVDRGTTTPHLVDQRQQRAAEWNHIPQGVAPQQQHGAFKEGFGRHVGIGNLAVHSDDDHWMRQRIEHRLSKARHGPEHGFGDAHAAAFCASVANASASKP